MNVSIAFSLSLNDTALEQCDNGFSVVMATDKTKIAVPILISNDKPVEEIREILHGVIDKTFDGFIRRVEEDE